MDPNTINIVGLITQSMNRIFTIGVPPTYDHCDAPIAKQKERKMLMERIILFNLIFDYDYEVICKSFLH